MSFADEWDMFPDCGVPVSTPATKINNAYFDKEFEEFCKLQRQQKAKAQPTEAVAEEAYLSFVEEAEKPKSKKKKKTEAVVEETSDETPVVEN